MWLCPYNFATGPRSARLWGLHPLLIPGSPWGRQENWGFHQQQTGDFTWKNAASSSKSWGWTSWFKQQKHVCGFNQTLLNMRWKLKKNVFFCRTKELIPTKVGFQWNKIVQNRSTLSTLMKSDAWGYAPTACPPLVIKQSHEISPCNEMGLGFHSFVKLAEGIGQPCFPFIIVKKPLITIS